MRSRHGGLKMKKQKSLRQLAKELGVSHSYLSQVLHGKRPASEKVQEALNMVSMVSNTEASIGLKIRRSNILVGSSPTPGTSNNPVRIFCNLRLIASDYPLLVQCGLRKAGGWEVGCAELLPVYLTFFSLSPSGLLPRYLQRLARIS